MGVQIRPGFALPVRLNLADDPGCHEYARAPAFAAWCSELAHPTGDEAASWLDVEFAEPCLEGQQKVEGAKGASTPDLSCGA